MINPLKQILTGLIFLCALAALPAMASANVLEEADKKEVLIEAGDIVLGATLFRPAGAQGDLPVIVTAHGSAPTDRNGVGFYTYRALQMGFAVVAFDKRGVGESSGEYVPFSVETSAEIFEKLASDVAFAVRWVAGQEGIDESRIGLFGGSQAGWIMPLAASKEPLVKFIIIGEGVPVSAGEEALHAEISGDGAYGWNRSLIEEADRALVDFRGDKGYDPGPVLEVLDIPILWLFGLRDEVIPVNPSLDRLETLTASGKTNHEIHIFPFGDHNFTNRATGVRYDVKKIAERWLREKGFLQ